jgi:hypothetical protein
MTKQIADIFLKCVITYPIIFLNPCISYASPLGNDEFSGNVGLETRVFAQNQHSQSAITVEPEYYRECQSPHCSFTLRLFARLDNLDDRRSRMDIREMSWLYTFDNWELRLGIDKVFWGVTESNHLVDIINQTDFSGSVDGEQKLGQPMVQWSLVNDWGTLEAFMLPLFRERIFPGENGRLGTSIKIDSSQSRYESENKQKHIDWALRYSHTVGNWDLGVSYFTGTNRKPVLIPEINDGVLSLSPYYNQMNQIGISAQITIDAWLFKLETLYRQTRSKSYGALSTGFEYTLFSVADSTLDLGLLMEINRDSRNETSTDPLQNDLFMGARVSFNDVQDTGILIGAIADLSFDASYSLFLEANRRLGNGWRMIIDARTFSASDQRDVTYWLRTEDYVSATLEYYF